MENKKGFTLLELIIVVIILAILATVAVVNYGSIKELALDKDAISALKLIRAAERTHRMDMGTYYPPVGSDSNIVTINTNLKTLLPAGSDRAWNYTVWSNGCSRATRNVSGGRSWYFKIDDADDTPDVGAGCP